MNFDIIVIGSVPAGRRGDPGGAAWAQSCRPGARARRRNLPQLGFIPTKALLRAELGEDAGGIDPRRFPPPHAPRNDACGRPRPGNS
jgi:hypothetical protein